MSAMSQQEAILRRSSAGRVHRLIANVCCGADELLSPPPAADGEDPARGGTLLLLLLRPPSLASAPTTPLGEPLLLPVEGLRVCRMAECSFERRLSMLIAGLMSL